MKQIFGKLVRDKIPEIITAKGETPQTRVLDDEQFRVALLAKLQEEVQELVAAEGKVDIEEEIADVLEVLHALTDTEECAWEDIERIRKEKKERRGGFSGKIYLESTE